MVCLKNSLLTSPQLLYNTNRKRWEHLWKRTVANMEHELPLKHAIAPCSFNTSFLAGNLGLGVCNFPFFCVLRTLAAVHNKNRGQYITNSNKDYYGGKSLKIAMHLYFVLVDPPQMGNSMTPEKPRIRSPTNQGLTTTACTMLHQHLGECPWCWRLHASQTQGSKPNRVTSQSLIKGLLWMINHHCFFNNPPIRTYFLRGDWHFGGGSQKTNGKIAIYFEPRSFFFEV